MNKSKVIELAREADVWVAGQAPYQEQLERFAALIEAEARGDAEQLFNGLTAQETTQSASVKGLTQTEKAEPVAWVITSEMQDGTKQTYALMGRYKDVCDACDFGEPIPLYRHPAPAVVAQLVEALEEARHDVNWMLNNKQFLNPFVFDYIDAALAAVRGQE